MRTKVFVSCVAASEIACGVDRNTDSLGTSAAPVNVADYVFVPGISGRALHRDCVHSVPNGAQVRDNGDVYVDGKLVDSFGICTHAPLAPLPGNGWVEDAHEPIPNSPGYHFSSMTNQWSVPQSPTTSNAAPLYLWSGLENSARNAVVQPVLQWGYNGKFGSQEWDMTVWYVYTDATGHLVSVYNHDYLANLPVGHLLQADEWDILDPNHPPCGIQSEGIQATDVTSGQSRSMSVSWQAWGHAFSGVLEGYNISLCSDFPASSTTFTSPTLNETYENRTGTYCPTQNGNTNTFAVESWYSTVGFPSGCGYNVSLNTNGQATLSP